jgi:hypothetical protein
MHDDSFFITSNYIEATLWACIGIGFFLHASRAVGQRRRTSLHAGITFLFFGASDIVETTTGAWWRPWWLFAWKAACVVALLALLVGHLRRRKKA